MRLGRIGPDEIFHRLLTPKWVFLPTSGAGAAIRGGRFNRPGVEALYLSRAPQTALEEYRQGGTIAPITSPGRLSPRGLLGIRLFGKHCGKFSLHQ